MKESRSVRFGKFLASEINQVIELLFEDSRQRRLYKRELIKYLDHNFEPRKKGEPKKQAHESELECINVGDYSLRSPEHYASRIRESLHRGYNANNSNLVLRTILENL